MKQETVDLYRWREEANIAGFELEIEDLSTQIARKKTELKRMVRTLEALFEYRDRLKNVRVAPVQLEFDFSEGPC